MQSRQMALITFRDSLTNNIANWWNFSKGFSGCLVAFSGCLLGVSVVHRMVGIMSFSNFSFIGLQIWLETQQPTSFISSATHNKWKFLLKHRNYIKICFVTCFRNTSFQAIRIEQTPVSCSITFLQWMILCFYLKGLIINCKWVIRWFFLYRNVLITFNYLVQLIEM